MRLLRNVLAVSVAIPATPMATLAAPPVLDTPRVVRAVAPTYPRVIFTVLGSFAAQLSAWLSRRPRAVAAANVGAGLTFIAAGLSILALDRRR
jgi:hypothetical protein